MYWLLIFAFALSVRIVVSDKVPNWINDRFENTGGRFQVYYMNDNIILPDGTGNARSYDIGQPPLSMIWFFSKPRKPKGTRAIPDTVFRFARPLHGDQNVAGIPLGLPGRIALV